MHIFAKYMKTFSNSVTEDAKCHKYLQSSVLWLGSQMRLTRDIFYNFSITWLLSDNTLFNAYNNQRSHIPGELAK